MIRLKVSIIIIVLYYLLFMMIERILSETIVIQPISNLRNDNSVSTINNDEKEKNENIRTLERLNELLIPCECATLIFQFLEYLNSMIICKEDQEKNKICTSTIVYNEINEYNQKIQYFFYALVELGIYFSNAYNFIKILLSLNFYMNYLLKHLNVNNTTQIVDKQFNPSKLQEINDFNIIRENNYCDSNLQSNNKNVEHETYMNNLKYVDNNLFGEIKSINMDDILMTKCISTNNKIESNPIQVFDKICNFYFGHIMIKHKQIEKYGTKEYDVYKYRHLEYFLNHIKENNIYDVNLIYTYLEMILDSLMIIIYHKIPTLYDDVTFLIIDEERRRIVSKLRLVKNCPKIMIDFFESLPNDYNSFLETKKHNITHITIVDDYYDRLKLSLVEFIYGIFDIEEFKQYWWIFNICYSLKQRE